MIWPPQSIRKGRIGSTVYFTLQERIPKQGNKDDERNTKGMKI